MDSRLEIQDFLSIHREPVLSLVPKPLGNHPGIDWSQNIPFRHQWLRDCRNRIAPLEKVSIGLLVPGTHFQSWELQAYPAELKYSPTL
ncbi:MAG: hypothetical protein LBQ32_07320 [Burkholderiaceae bacterium]|nr:hypothetical protein [Burkholderiaceae bacterium]